MDKPSPEAELIALATELEGWLKTAKEIMKNDNPFFIGGACTQLVQSMIELLEKRSL
jgi:hypothetical protein